MEEVGSSELRSKEGPVVSRENKIVSGFNMRRLGQGLNFHASAACSAPPSRSRSVKDSLLWHVNIDPTDVEPGVGIRLMLSGSSVAGLGDGCKYKVFPPARSVGAE